MNRRVLLVTTIAVMLPMAAYAGAKASAFQKETKLGTNYWNAGSAIDGKPETAWMVPGESANRGEWIELDVPGGTVDKLTVMIGYAKNDETFKDYARIKQARVDMFNLDDNQTPVQVGTANVTFEDKAGLQTVDLPDTKVGGDLFGGKVRISVMDIYPGDDYPNLGISEVSVVMGEFDTATKITASSGEGAGHAKDLAIDEDAKTFWTLPAAGASFTIDGSGFGISSVQFTAPTKEFKAYSRPKTVEITINGLTRQTVLADSTAPQSALVPAFNGYTGGATGELEVKIIDTYPGTSTDIAIASLKSRATNASAF